VALNFRLGPLFPLGLVAGETGAIIPTTAARVRYLVAVFAHTYTHIHKYYIRTTCRSLPVDLYLRPALDRSVTKRINARIRIICRYLRIYNSIYYVLCACMYTWFGRWRLRREYYRCVGRRKNETREEPSIH